MVVIVLRAVLCFYSIRISPGNSHDHSNSDRHRNRDNNGLSHGINNDNK